MMRSLRFLTLPALALIGYAILVFIGGTQSTARVGDQAPPLRVPSLATDDPSRMVDLASYQGRSVVLNFWASWCSACELERPLLVDLQQRGMVAMLGVAIADDEESARRTEQEKPHGYPVGIDLDDAVAASYGVSTLPQTLVIGADGRILRRYAQALNSKDVDEIIGLLTPHRGPIAKAED